MAQRQPQRQPQRIPQQQRQPQQQRPPQRRRRQRQGILRTCCGPCDTCSRTCDSSILFLGFIAFYIVSFLWDVFVIRGGYLALSIAQRPACVDRAEFYDINPDLVLTLLFVACFHAISLVWIIGFMHSKQITNTWLGSEIVDVPREWPRICGYPCDWAICIPGTLFESLMIIEFGLSIYVYLFLDDLMEVEPEEFVEHFCVGFEEAEEAHLWMQISLIFFMGTVIMSCVYWCLLRIGTNDISMFEPGQQRFHNLDVNDRARQSDEPLNPNRRIQRNERNRNQPQQP